LEQQDLLARPDKQVQPAQPAQKVTKVIPERQDQLAQLDHKDQLV
jgi:hypothetical protein